MVAAPVVAQQERQESDPARRVGRADVPLFLQFDDDALKTGCTQVWIGLQFGKPGGELALCQTGRIFRQSG